MEIPALVRVEMSVRTLSRPSSTMDFWARVLPIPRVQWAAIRPVFQGFINIVQNKLGVG